MFNPTNKTNSINTNSINTNSIKTNSIKTKKNDEKKGYNIQECKYDKSQLHKIDDNIVSYKNVKFSVDFPKDMYETILQCEKCTFFGLWDDYITEQCMDCEFGIECDNEDSDWV